MVYTMRYTSVVLGLLCCPILVHAQGTRLLRQPTVSNTQMAFAYAGDIWVASRDGGDAQRLTWHPSPDIARGWSPDAKRILFSSARASAPSVGVQQLWTIAATGGVPERLPIPDALRGSFSPQPPATAQRKVLRWER